MYPLIWNLCLNRLDPRQVGVRKEVKQTISSLAGDRSSIHVALAIVFGDTVKIFKKSPMWWVRGDMTEF